MSHLGTTKNDGTHADFKESLLMVLGPEMAQ